MEFEWDQKKASRNKEKHGVSFETAASCFRYPLLTKVDDRFEYGEVRLQSIGVTPLGAYLCIIHTEREGRIRIISARKASSKERQVYERERLGKN